MNIGIIGTGMMGLPVSEQLLKHGFNLYFYARKKATIDALIYSGAHFVGMSEIGITCDAVILFVNNYSQCLECMTEMLKNMEHGTIIVCSTISPDEMEELASLCLQKGVVTIAAPVTGGVKGAIEGTLTVITSGNETIVKELNPVFSAFGKNIIFSGENIRCAHTLKLLVQMLVGINTVAMSEVFTLGIKNGLDANLIFNVISHSAGTTRIFENRGESVIKRDFSKRGTVAILNKDLKSCMIMGNRISCPIPLAQLCANIFQMGMNALDDTDQDFSAIIKLYELWAGIALT